MFGCVATCCPTAGGGPGRAQRKVMRRSVKQSGAARRFTIKPCNCTFRVSSFSNYDTGALRGDGGSASAEEQRV